MTNSPLPPAGAFDSGTSVAVEGSLFTGGLVTSTSDVLAATDEAGSAEFEPPQLALIIEKIAMETGTKILRMGFLGSGSYRVLLVEEPS
jgi:hypothetical protein